MQTLKTDCPHCGRTHEVVIQPEMSAQQVARLWADAMTLLGWASDCWQDGQLRPDFDDCVDAIRAFLPARAAGEGQAG